MKYLLLLVVVGVALFVLFGRQRRPADPESPRARGKPGAAAPMLACAHCGVHTPRDECETDDAGRSYCSTAHRLAGPR